MARLLLAVRADPDRVAVLEVVTHVSSERDGDRLRVLRVTRRSVADVDRRDVDDPSGQSFEVRGVSPLHFPALLLYCQN